MLIAKEYTPFSANPKESVINIFAKAAFTHMAKE
jgi:hypothetical protein